MKLLDGGTPRCQRCGRMVTQRHKERPGGPWCTGTPDPDEPLRDRAIEAFSRLQDAFMDLYFDGRAGEALALVEEMAKRCPPRKRVGAGGGRP